MNYCKILLFSLLAVIVLVGGYFLYMAWAFPAVRCEAAKQRPPRAWPRNGMRASTASPWCAVRPATACPTARARCRLPACPAWKSAPAAIPCPSDAWKPNSASAMIAAPVTRTIRAPCTVAPTSTACPAPRRICNARGPYKDRHTGHASNNEVEHMNASRREFLRCSVAWPCKSNGGQ